MVLSRPALFGVLFAAACHSREQPVPVAIELTAQRASTSGGPADPRGSSGPRALPASAPDPLPGPPTPRVSPPTLEKAGVRTCALEAPVDIATTPDSDSLFGAYPAGIVFGPAGGLLVWQAGRGSEAWARPIGADGRPAGPATPFHVEGKFLLKKAFAFEGGFAFIASVFDVDTLSTSYFVHVLGPKGEPLGQGTQLDVGDFFFEDEVSEMVDGRFLLLGGPNQAKSLQRARVLLVRVDSSGAVQQKAMEFLIGAPVAVRPAVSYALSRTHWAMTVQVAGGGARQPIVIDGKVMETVPFPGMAQENPIAATRSLIVDGTLVPIQGAETGTYGVLSQTHRYQIAWAGDALAVGWPVDGGRAHFGRLSLDGQLADPAPAEEKTLRGAFEESVSTEYVSGPDGTTLSRRRRFGAEVGTPTRLDGVLPDVGGAMLPMESAWSGDRFVLAYSPTVGATRPLRVVGMRCDGTGKKPR